MHRGELGATPVVHVRHRWLADQHRHLVVLPGKRKVELASYRRESCEERQERISVVAELPADLFDGDSGSEVTKDVQPFVADGDVRQKPFEHVRHAAEVNRNRAGQRLAVKLHRRVSLIAGHRRPAQHRPLVQAGVPQLEDPNPWLAGGREGDREPSEILDLLDEVIHPVVDELGRGLPLATLVEADLFVLAVGLR